jgi:hypothetical protein
MEIVIGVFWQALPKPHKSRLFSFSAFQLFRIPPYQSPPHENPPKNSPKSIAPWCLGHKKGPHVMQAYDFDEGTG